MTLDIEKAFDWVNYLFLITVIEKYGFNKTKPTSRSAFIVNLFALESGKESRNDKRTLFLVSPRSLDLSLNT